MDFRIVEFKDVSKEAYYDYIREWEERGERIIPSASKRNGEWFENLQLKWQEDITDKAYEAGFVPSTLYFMVDDNGKIIGAIHLRHELNDSLLQHGGHIGYGIRPSERKKGYASLMLGQFLELIKDKGYEKVLITCDDDNLGSARTIENNKGVLADKPVIEGVLTRRYWVTI